MTTVGKQLRLTRRTFLGAVGGVSAAGLGWPGPAATQPREVGPGDEGQLAAVRSSWSELLTGGAADPADPDVAAAVAALDATAGQYLDLVDRSSDRAQVFTDLSLDGNGRPASSRMRDTLQRLEHLATAYCTSGSEYEGDADVLSDVLDGLETTNVEVYNAEQPQFGSWFHFQISAPHALGNTCVLLHEHIDDEALARYVAAIDHFVPRPRGTGANRVDLCQTVLVGGVIGNDGTKVQQARDGLSPVFRYVRDGDGFYRDGSVLQHQTVAYTGSYGVELLGGFSNLGIAKQMAVLAGTPWEITGPDRDFVFDVVDRSYIPMVYDGQVLDYVRGRSISRDFQSGHDRGRLVIEAVARLARAADEETAQRWRATCKGWLERKTYQGPFAAATPAQVALFKELLSAAVDSLPEPVTHSLFPNMDRVIHRRTGWGYAISMASTRISYYESINNENIKGFHTGDGMTYLYNADNGQYSDDFWPTVNPYRLPGITVDSAPLPDSAGDTGRPTPDHATWVGGAVLGGELGAVGMDVEPLLTSLRAKKSWFCLDDSVVALGAGISGGGAEYPVETVVENRNLGADGTPALTIDGDHQPLTQGWSTSRQARWAHLDGVGGFLFDGDTTVNFLREERTGRWSDIGDLGGTAPEDPITRRYATMWFDHGIQPDEGRYSYILIPGASPAETADRARERQVSIVANSAEVQAVRVNRLALFAANFWQAGTLAAITPSAPCSVLISGWRRPHTDSMTIAVSDPTHELASLDLRVVAPGFDSYEADDSVTVNNVFPAIELRIDTAGSKGATHTATFYPR